MARADSSDEKSTESRRVTSNSRNGHVNIQLGQSGICGSISCNVGRIVGIAPRALRAGTRQGSRANRNGASDMNAKPLISFIAAALFSLSAHALECAGGASGGMDATGNECNDATTVGMIASSDGAKPAAARSSKVHVNDAASYSQSADKHTASTRRTSGRPPVKNG